MTMVAFYWLKKSIFFYYLIYFYYYLDYFCYYLLIALHFLVLYMDFIVLFKLPFNFIYDTFTKKLSVSTK